MNRYRLTDAQGQSWEWTEDELADTLFENEHWEDKESQVEKMKVGQKLKAGGETLERLENPRTPAEAAEYMVERYGSKRKASDHAASSRADADFDWQDSGPRGARNDAILEQWDYWDQVIEHIHGRPTGAVRPDRRFAASGFSSRKLKARLLR